MKQEPQDAMRHGFSRAWDGLRKRFEIDTRALAAFRITVGFLILIDIVLRSRNFAYFYTESGVVPLDLAAHRASSNAFSFYHYTTEPVLILGLFFLTGLVGLQLILGYKTRIATVLAFLLVISLDHRNGLVLSYADTLFRFLLFWAIFLPLGERWSIDSVHRDKTPRTRVAGLATIGYLAQFVYMYFRNGLHKTESDLWWSGDATPLIMGITEITILLGDIAATYPTALRYGGLTWFYLLLGSGLLILFTGRWRAILVLMLLIGHASFAITVRIGAFPFVAIAGLIPFLQTVIWDDATRILRRWTPRTHRCLNDLQAKLRSAALKAPTLTLDSPTMMRWKRATDSSAIMIVAVVLTVYTITAFAPVPGMTTSGLDERVELHDQIDHHLQRFGINQPGWTIFAPEPRTLDRYYIFAAETTSGDLIDVYNDRPLSADRPGDDLHTQYDTYRERFYMNDVRRAALDDRHNAHELLAEHICQTWPDEHGDELARLSMYYIRERITLETITIPENRDTRAVHLYDHGCGGHEAETIPLPEA